jgi:heterodisulfide reductase subunit C
MIQIGVTPGESVFPREISAASGQDLIKCLQCGKCSGGCPVYSAAKDGPRRVISLILDGLKHQAMASKLIWYCVGCSTCASRCPVDIDFAPVATALVERAKAEGLAPSVRDLEQWEERFLLTVRFLGRVSEVPAILLYNVPRLRPFQDMGAAVAMFQRGILKPVDVVPRRSPGQAEVAEIFARVKQIEQTHGEAGE